MHTFNQALEIVNKQWDEEKKLDHQQRRFPHWHGFATIGETLGSTLVLLVKKNIPEDEAARLQAAFSQISDALVTEIMKTKEFRMAGGSDPLRPGDFINAFNLRCTDDKHQPCPGTVGAFFKKSGADKPIWLLTCLHVLHAMLNDEDTCGGQVQVDVNGVTISKGPLFFDPHSLDPAAKSIDMGMTEVTMPVSAFYNGLTLQSTTPFRPPAGDLVQKLGAVSGVTCGKIVNYSNTAVEVLACKGVRTFLYEDVIFIQSLDGKPPFAQRGDSGSLVVSTGKPVGLLFAVPEPGIIIQDEGKRSSKLRKSFKRRFGREIINWDSFETF